jgi:hypothetical protein
MNRLMGRRGRSVVLSGRAVRGLAQRRRARIQAVAGAIAVATLTRGLSAAVTVRVADGARVPAARMGGAIEVRPTVEWSQA